MHTDTAGYKNTLHYTLLPFARQYIQDNFGYQKYNVIYHYARIFIVNIQSSDCNPIDNI